MQDVVESLRGGLGWLAPLAGAVLATLVAVAIHTILYAIARRLARRTEGVADEAFVEHSRRPAALLMAAFALQIALPSLGLPDTASAGMRHVLALVLIGATAWLLVRLLDVMVQVVAARFPVDVRDNLDARRIQTQMRVLRRVLTVVILLVALAAAIMTFPTVRQLGTGLMASAGVAGLVVGMAARPVLSNLLSGIQIALTQPIRLDDVVIVEGEWGRIEEVTSTYVVVAIWDDRRLIVPLSYFQEKPFQNWTRTRAELLGTVMLYADYTVPVEALRAELKRILDATDLWDQRVWGLDVTHATEHAVELRALMSARDSGAAWSLRCLVREKLIAYLREHHPDSLPRTRATVDEVGGTPPAPRRASR